MEIVVKKNIGVHIPGGTYLCMADVGFYLGVTPQYATLIPNRFNDFPPIISVGRVRMVEFEDLKRWAREHPSVGPDDAPCRTVGDDAWD